MQALELVYIQHSCEIKKRCHKESVEGKVCCYCGRDQDQHDNNIVIDCDKWNYKDHTATCLMTHKDYGPHSLSSSGPKVSSIML